jgi:hypothetical protein
MALLDGEISGLFGTVFGGLYLPGTLTRVGLIPDGEGGGTTSESSQACRVQVDACTEAMRAQAGYTERDVRILILQHGIAGGDLDTDCAVTVNSGRHAGRKFNIMWHTQDPASSYWECRGSPA